MDSTLNFIRKIFTPTENQIKMWVVTGIVIFAATLPGVKFQNGKLNVLPFSNHAYENGNHHSIIGPFLSKIRFRPDDIAINFKSGYVTNQKQSACHFNLTAIVNEDDKKKLAIREEKCKIMRVPDDLHLGHVHSAWSVLGAQNNYNLIKHICFILIVFLLFSLFEEMIYSYPKNQSGKEEHHSIRHHHHFVRSVLLIIAIILFGVDVLFDIDSDNISEVQDYKSKYAIGSITTGFSFCVVTLMIMCFTYMQEPYDPKKSTGAKEPSTVGNVNSTQDQSGEGGDGLNSKNIQFGSFFDYEDYVNGDRVSRPSYSERSPNYKRLCDIYYNIHTSYLTLLIFPLIVIVALHSTKTVFVDVHIQMIFFSSIFFALLDICQALVMSVLSTFDENHTIFTPIGNVKVFVVLAFLLCKSFVYAPSFQLILLYYVKENLILKWLIFMQIILVLASAVFDLVYIVNLFKETTYLNIKKVVFTIYIFISLGLLCAV
jgi:hypothetical protein